MPELPFLTEPLRTNEDVIARAREIGKSNGLSRVVVASAEESDVLSAMYLCKQEGIADSVLVGYPDRVCDAMDEAEIPRDTFEIIGVANEQEAAIKSAELAGSGDVDIVMKGFIKTSTLLKTLLSHEYGLRDRELLSHSAAVYVPAYKKIINITDGGILVAPSFEQKLTILANGVRVMRSLGIEKPKIAVLAPAKTIRDDIPETITASLIAEIAEKHWSENIEIFGPMTFEQAVMDPEKLGFESDNPVSGQADMLLAHTIEEANLTVKTLVQFGGGIFMGVISGAKVPVSLVSRSDSTINKKSSIALAVCVADFQKRDFKPLQTFAHFSDMEAGS